MTINLKWIPVRRKTLFCSILNRKEVYFPGIPSKFLVIKPDNKKDLLFLSWQDKITRPGAGSLKLSRVFKRGTMVNDAISCQAFGAQPCIILCIPSTISYVPQVSLWSEKKIKKYPWNSLVHTLGYACTRHHMITWMSWVFRFFPLLQKIKELNDTSCCRFYLPAWCMHVREYDAFNSLE